MATAHDDLPPGLGQAPFVGFVPVRDLDVARLFYEGTLGLAVTTASPFALVIDAGGTSLRLTEVPGLEAQPFTIAGWEVTDITAVVDLLASRGVAFRRYGGMEQDERGIWTTPGGDRVAWFGDTDGNTLSLTMFA
jgi:catechol 2,3-dioxygenase-like lactoylglutathione lyase family enzyme